MGRGDNYNNATVYTGGEACLLETTRGYSGNLAETALRLAEILRERGKLNSR